MQVGSGVDALDNETRSNIARALWLEEFRPELLPADVLERIGSERNSSAAFGARMQARLRYLLDHPDSYAPSNKRRYETLLAHSAALSPHQAYAMTVLLDGDSSKGYQQIPGAANLRFPQANAEQLRTQVGWYFFVGSCVGENGREYGVELMIWRYALLPVPLARQFGLSDIENQVVELQFAISEAGDRHYQATPIVIAGTTGLLAFAPDRLGATLGKNSVRSLDAENMFPLQLQAKGRYEGAGGPVDLGIDLTIASGKEYLLQGDDGCAPCCAGVGTLYYSMPHLRLDPARSTLTLKGEEIRLTGGTFWFDHQWGTGMIPVGNPRSGPLRAAARLAGPGVAGWDWFMAQFEGNRQLTGAALHSPTMAQFYSQTGPTPPGPMSVAVNGKYMDEHGRSRDVAGSMTVTDWFRSVDTPDPAQYEPTETWYPNGWEFAFGSELPDDIRTFSMTPIVSGGQDGFFAFGGHYSEGATVLADGHGREIGRGFGESVQYADTRRTMLRLAGLPETDDMFAMLAATPASWLSKLEAIAYLAWPSHGAELKRVLAGAKGLGTRATPHHTAGPHG